MVELVTNQEIQQPLNLRERYIAATADSYIYLIGSGTSITGGRESFGENWEVLTALEDELRQYPEDFSVTTFNLFQDGDDRPADTERFLQEVSHQLTAITGEPPTEKKVEYAVKKQLAGIEKKGVKPVIIVRGFADLKDYYDKWRDLPDDPDKSSMEEALNNTSDLLYSIRSLVMQPEGNPQLVLDLEDSISFKDMFAKAASPWSNILYMLPALDHGSLQEAESAMNRIYQALQAELTAHLNVAGISQVVVERNDLRITDIVTQALTEADEKLTIINGRTYRDEVVTLQQKMREANAQEKLPVVTYAHTVLEDEDVISMKDTNGILLTANPYESLQEDSRDQNEVKLEKNESKGRNEVEPKKKMRGGFFFRRKR